MIITLQGIPDINYENITLLL